MTPRSFAFAQVVLLAALACNETSPNETQGAGGACITSPHVTFHVTVETERDDEFLPLDTTILVVLTSNTEKFVLGDEASWKPTSGLLVCPMPDAGTPPTNLTRIACDLTTNNSGADLTVQAAGFVGGETVHLTPKTRDDCTLPFPSDVTITLRRPDAGMSP